MQELSREQTCISVVAGANASTMRCPEGSCRQTVTCQIKRLNMLSPEQIPSVESLRVFLTKNHLLLFPNFLLTQLNQFQCAIVRDPRESHLKIGLHAFIAVPCG